MLLPPLPPLLLLRYQSLYIMAIPSCCFSLTFWVFKCQHVKMVNFPRQARDKHRENAFEKAVIIIVIMATPSCCFSLAGFSMPKTIILPRQARDRHSGKLMKILSLSDHYGYYHGYSFLCYRLLYRSLACLRACLWPLPLLRCFPAAGERTRQLSTAPRSHSLSLSSCFVFRSCALCLVERPQNADCSDETGVVMPAPPPPPATTVRSLRPVCAYSSFCDILCIA